MERPTSRLGESQMEFNIRLAQWSSMAMVRNHILEEASRAVAAFKEDYMDIEGSWALSQAIDVIDALKTEI